LAFAGFVIRALRSGTPISTCGCFGRPDTPPSPAHVALNLAYALTLVGASFAGAPAPLETLVEGGYSSVVPAALAALLGYVTWAVYAVLPQALPKGGEA